MMDEDGNGSLDRYELEMGLADIGGIPQHEIDGLFFALDTSQDDEVTGRLVGIGWLLGSGYCVMSI